MVEFYKIKSTHGYSLSLNREENYICGQIEEESTQTDQIFGFSFDDPSKSFFLISENCTLIKIHGEHYETKIYPLNCEFDADHTVFLSHLKTDKFLSGAPVGGENLFPHIAIDRYVSQGWEKFSLTKITPEIDEKLSLIISLVEMAYKENFSEDVFFEILLLSNETCAPVIDLFYFFCGDLFFTSIADKVLKCHFTRNNLEKIYPADIWINTALPDLVSWHADRNRPRSSFLIDEEFDQIGKQSLKRGIPRFTHVLLCAIRRQINPRKKSCIVTTARNEGIYMLEWISHYKSIGFDHIFIYTNGNNDGSEEMLEILAENGIITLIKNIVSEGVSPQSKAFIHAFSVLPDVLDYEWCLVADMDEFLLLNKSRLKNISDLIRKVSLQKTDWVAINWLFAASSETDVLEKPLLERNQKIVNNAWIGDGYRLVKSMFRPRLAIQSAPHFPIFDNMAPMIGRTLNGEINRFSNNPPGFSNDPMFSDHTTYNSAFVLHCFFKSSLEWLWKTSRTRGDQPYSANVSEIMFKDHWFNNFVLQYNKDADDVPLHYRPDGLFRSELAQLRAIPRIADLERDVQENFRTRIAAVKEYVKNQGIQQKLGQPGQDFFKIMGM